MRPNDGVRSGEAPPLVEAPTRDRGEPFPMPGQFLDDHSSSPVLARAAFARPGGAGYRARRFLTPFSKCGHRSCAWLQDWRGLIFAPLTVGGGRDPFFEPIHDQLRDVVFALTVGNMAHLGKPD